MSTGYRASAATQTRARREIRSSPGAVLVVECQDRVHLAGLLPRGGHGQTAGLPCLVSACRLLVVVLGDARRIKN
ncbi:hypothetical protein [Streptomyces sp. NPDC007984]|uniref:hypothetical protein n=1 Tax=Streptomyces sp. NPDC007984 TaxID=3364801 RepID=UPI0036EF5C38